MKYLIEDQEYEIKIIKKNNKRTYIRYQNNQIIITTNILATDKYILKLLKENEETIKKIIKKTEKKEIKNNEFYYLGKKYDKIIVPTLDELFFSNNDVYIKSEIMLEKWLNKEIKKLFEERLIYNLNLFEENIKIPKLKIRTMKTRWGVCNKKNHTITLNSLLIRYDIICLDYVIIHELAHFIHFDHSKEFWKLVEKYCKNYKEIRKILKD